MIPIVALLTHHQRKMAEIVHRTNPVQDPAVLDEVLRLRDEVNRLRIELQETTIALDDLRGKPQQLSNLANQARLENRIGEN